MSSFKLLVYGFIKRSILIAHTLARADALKLTLVFGKLSLLIVFAHSFLILVNIVSFNILFYLFTYYQNII